MIRTAKIGLATVIIAGAAAPALADSSLGYQNFETMNGNRGPVVMTYNGQMTSFVPVYQHLECWDGRPGHLMVDGTVACTSITRTVQVTPAMEPGIDYIVVIPVE